MKKLTPWYLAAIAPVVVAGCTGAFLGHMAVLAVVLCIFVGTLTMGRPPRAIAGATAAGPGVAPTQVAQLAGSVRLTGPVATNAPSHAA